MNSSCIEEEKCEHWHVKSLLPQDLLAACNWHFIMSEGHSLLNGILERLLECRSDQVLQKDHYLKQDNLSSVRTEERKTLPAPPPPPKPVDTHTSNFPITFSANDLHLLKKVRLESSLRAPPGLVKLRQKIQLHTTKLKPTDYVGFSKLPYQVRKTKQRYHFV